jgi:hypothetical protein
MLHSWRCSCSGPHGWSPHPMRAAPTPLPSAGRPARRWRHVMRCQNADSSTGRACLSRPPGLSRAAQPVAVRRGCTRRGMCRCSACRSRTSCRASTSSSRSNPRRSARFRTRWASRTQASVPRISLPTDGITARSPCRSIVSSCCLSHPGGLSYAHPCLPPLRRTVLHLASSMRLVRCMDEAQAARRPAHRAAQPNQPCRRVVP